MSKWRHCAFSAYALASGGLFYNKVRNLMVSKNYKNLSFVWGADRKIIRQDQNFISLGKHVDANGDPQEIVLSHPRSMIDSCSILAWVKVFRIIPEFRILGLTFHRTSIESQPQNPELDRLYLVLWFNFSLSEDNRPFNLEIVGIYRHTVSFKIWFSKVQHIGNFYLSPMY